MTFFEDHLRSLGQWLDAALVSLAGRVRSLGDPGRFSAGARSGRRDRGSFEIDRWWRDPAESIERSLSRRGLHVPVERIGRAALAAVLLVVIVGVPLLARRLSTGPSAGAISAAQQEEVNSLSSRIIGERAASLQPGSPRVVGRK